MLNKKVGIIVPIYDVGEYLAECLDTILAQSYQNFHVILVDDESNDNSYEIAKEYAKNDNRFTLISKKNGGQSTARNVGIKYFSGEYELKFRNKDELENYEIIGENKYFIKSISNAAKLEQIPQIDYLIFIDPDDFWDKDCLKDSVERMDGVQVLWFDHQLYGTEQEMPWYDKMAIYGYKDEKIISKEQWLEDAKNVGELWWLWSGMIDFAFLKSIKLEFLPGIWAEDHYFGTLLFYQAIYISKETLLLQNQRKFQHKAKRTA